MSKIIILNQANLGSKDLEPYLPLSKDLDMLRIFNSIPMEAMVPYVGLMPRQGINNLPLPRLLDQYVNVSMPQYDPKFSLSWGEITDQRSIEIEKLLDDSDQSLTIQWSGGIDSTCIVAAVIKNFKQCNLEKVTIACNWGSIIENPVFYENHIRKNFRCVDINQQTRTASGITIGGEIADKLSMSVNNIDQYMGVRNPDLYSKSWKLYPDQLIEYFIKVFNYPDFGIWLFEKISENIDTVDVPVETYFDFMWWINFNYHWHGSVLLEWLYHHSDLAWDHHQRHFIRWYENDDYQKWSMTNGFGDKYGTGISSIKKQAKQYIFDLDKNAWYRDYKIKISSAGRRGNDPKSNVFAVTDDFRILCLDRDLDEIIDLLPEHFGQV